MSASTMVIQVHMIELKLSMDNTCVSSIRNSTNHILDLVNGGASVNQKLINETTENHRSLNNS